MAEPRFGARLASLEIPGPDPAALARFYEDVFGWRAGEPASSGQWRPLSAGDDRGGGGGLAAAVTTPGELGIDRAVAVIDVAGTGLDGVLAAVTAAGGRVEKPPRRVGDHGSFALFRDPAGNVLGLWAAAAP